VWWPIPLLLLGLLAVVWFARRTLRLRERMNARGQLLPESGSRTAASAAGDD
jgi:hypothetical protein